MPANVTTSVPQELMNVYGEFLSQFIKKGALSLGKLIKWCFVAAPGYYLTKEDALAKLIKSIKHHISGA